MALMTFEVPSGYIPIPLGLNLEQARAYASERGERLGVPTGQRETQARQLKSWSTALRSFGALFAGVYWLNEKEPWFGSLLLAAQPLPHGDAYLASRGLALKLGDEEANGMAARPFDLPCGPASVFVRQIGLPTDGGRSAAGNDAIVLLGEFHAFIPVPPVLSAGREEMVVVAFQTPDLDHWETYSQHLVSLLKSIEFDEEPRDG